MRARATQDVQRILVFKHAHKPTRKSTVFNIKAGVNYNVDKHIKRGSLEYDVYGHYRMETYNEYEFRRKFIILP